MKQSGDAKLAGRRILVVEDEFYLAQDLSSGLSAHGGHIVGPVSTIEKARALIADKQVDFAVLDINLKGELIFSFAEELRRNNVPFLFTTGYDEAMIPAEFETVPCLAKPVATGALVQHLSGLRS